MTPNTCRFICIFLCLISGGRDICLQAQHPVWVRYDTNNGLPGDEVYDMAQDRSGYLWFATNQGICRFNGYEFIRPVDTSAMRGAAAFNPVEDPEGHIWFHHLDHTVHWLEKDTVRTWEFNHVISRYRGRFSLIEQMVIDQDRTVWLALRSLGLLAVRPDGTHQLYLESEEDCFIFHSVNGRVIYTSKGKNSRGNKPGDVTSSPKYRGIVFLEGEEPVRMKGIEWMAAEPSVLGGGIRLRDGGLLVFDAGSIHLIRENRQVWQTTPPFKARKIYELEDGSLFVASHFGENPGLLRMATLDQLGQGRYTNLLPGHFVTDFLVDREGGWWVSTHDQGIFYCKNPGIDVWDTSSGLTADDVICLADDGKQTIYAGLRPVAVCTIDQSTGTMRTLPRPPASSMEIQAIYLDTLRDMLWCGNPLCRLEKGSWKPVLYEGFRPFPAKKITPDPAGDRLWISSTFGFYRVENEGRFIERFGEEVPIPVRTLSVTSDQSGEIWVSTIDGLRLWKEDHYELPPFDHPALKYESSDVKVFPEGGMAISLRGGGLLLRDPAGRFTHFTRQDGLTDDFITSLYIPGEGALLACSNSGLNLLDLEPGGTWKVSVLTVKQGLPSNRVNDVRVLAGVTWIATDKGLVRVREVPGPGPMARPVLEKLLINNREEIPGKKMDLSHRQNNLILRFYALCYRAEGDIPYRYRLLGADTAFTYSHVREVNFANLSPGEYTFEVQAQNEGGEWSLPAQWSFRIRPAWWETGWFWGGALALFLGSLGWWYRHRLQQARQRVKIRNRIRELEAAALRAQINPHFIFNCLTSIQEFIAENETDEATRYLTRFARLVRLALHGSVDGMHSLADEVDMLDHYLALEQLRFEGKFTYSIQTAPELDPEEVSLPPMLVQPFVENAILHGMKEKAGDGRIEIVFSQNESTLEVSVSDNGPGFSAEKRTAARGHRSVGTQLTRQRLEVLSGKMEINTFQAENLVDSAGKVTGARVVLRIPVE